MDNRKIKTNDVIEFLFKSEINWVIISKDGRPMCWPDGNVKVYACVEDLMADFDGKSGQSIMTEDAFIRKVLEEKNNYNDYFSSLFD